MLTNTKRYKPIQEQYGWYDKYNFFHVYKKHDPLYIKVKYLILIKLIQDIDGAIPNPRMGI